MESCSCASHQAFDQTLRRYPEVWYEDNRLTRGVAFCVGLALTAGQLGSGVLSNLWLSVAAVAAALAGTLYDDYTTYAIIKLKPRFDKKKLEVPVYEAGRGLPPFPTLRQLIISWGTLISGAVICLGFVLPGLGVGWGMGRFLVGLNNHRQHQRLLLALGFLEESPIGQQGLENVKTTPTELKSSPTAASSQRCPPVS